MADMVKINTLKFCINMFEEENADVHYVTAYKNQLESLAKRHQVREDEVREVYKLFGILNTNVFKYASQINKLMQVQWLIMVADDAIGANTISDFSKLLNKKVNDGIVLKSAADFIRFMYDLDVVRPVDSVVSKPKPKYVPLDELKHKGAHKELTDVKVKSVPKTYGLDLDKPVDKHYFRVKDEDYGTWCIVTSVVQEGNKYRGVVVYPYNDVVPCEGGVAKRSNIIMSEDMLRKAVVSKNPQPLIDVSQEVLVDIEKFEPIYLDKIYYEFPNPYYTGCSNSSALTHMALSRATKRPKEARLVYYDNSNPCSSRYNYRHIEEDGTVEPMVGNKFNVFRQK